MYVVELPGQQRVFLGQSRTEVAFHVLQWRLACIRSGVFCRSVMGQISERRLYLRHDLGFVTVIDCVFDQFALLLAHRELRLAS